MSLPGTEDLSPRAQGWAAIPNWLVRDPRVDITTKVVYLVLSSYVNRDGTCYPSQEHIASLVDCSVRTVQRAIRDLRESGLVEVVTRANSHGRANVYYLSAHPFPRGG